MNKIPRESSIVICGTARNIEHKIDDTISKIMDAFSSFKEIRILICESFSTDKTVAKLTQIRANNKYFDFIHDNKIDKNENRRTVRIASARNELQSRVRFRYSDCDFVAMLDLDGVNRDLTFKSIESIWNYDSWDAGFANQPLRYYDIWALRAKGWSEGDCWKEYDELRQVLPPRKAKRIALTDKMRSIPKKSLPIPVESAFGGLGIYRTEAFLDGVYVGMDNEGNEVCEHVHFNQSLLEKGRKLYIFPSLVNLNKRSQLLNIFKEQILRVYRKIK